MSPLPLPWLRRYTRLSLGLLLPGLVACAAPPNLFLAKPESPANSTVPTSISLRPLTMLTPLQPGQSGIQGQILKQSGNFMPQIRMPTMAPMPAPNQTEPVQTQIWVFSGRLPAQGARWAIAIAQDHPQLLGQVASNALGEFSAQLPPGEYTVFAQYGDDLYLNGFQGDGNYATVFVQAGSPTELRLMNNEQAAF